jgi:hypothetical protein
MVTKFKDPKRQVMINQVTSLSEYSLSYLATLNQDGNVGGGDGISEKTIPRSGWKD